MTTYEKLRHLVIGKPLDPFSASTRQHIALAAFLAWVGLGADGLSSSAYGPEEAFKALGAHTHLGLYMALATAATIVDYVLTIAISVASGVDALFSLLPASFGAFKLGTELALVAALLMLNL